MQILTTTGSTQTLKVIPRWYAEDVTVELTDRNTKDKTTYSASTTFEKGYQLIGIEFSLVEDRFYTFEVYSNLELNVGALLYRGQIFCTDQTDLDNYQMNEDGYISRDDKDKDIIVF